MTAPHDPTRPPDRATSRKLPDASMSEFEGVRYLHLGRTPWVQGAMRLRKPRVIELEYVRRMMVWLLAHPAEAWTEAAAADFHAVQLGLGAAALTRYCHGELGLRSTAVELNPQVIGACRQWFRLPADDDRLTVLNADAGAWVAMPEHVGTVDALCIDLYDQQAAAPVLDDEDFYAHCLAVLAPGGTLVANLFGRNASFGRSARRIEALFAATGGQTVVLAPTDEGNTIVLAIKGGQLPEGEALADRARLVEARTGLKATQWLHLLRPVPVARARRVAALDPALADALPASR
jgi:spermidine synthase